MQFSENPKTMQPEFGRIIFDPVRTAPQLTIKSVRVRQGSFNMNPGFREMA